MLKMWNLYVAGTLMKHLFSSGVFSQGCLLISGVFLWDGQR